MYSFTPSAIHSSRIMSTDLCELVYSHRQQPNKPNTRQQRESKANTSILRSTAENEKQRAPTAQVQWQQQHRRYQHIYGLVLGQSG